MFTYIYRVATVIFTALVLTAGSYAAPPEAEAGVTVKVSPSRIVVKPAITIDVRPRNPGRNYYWVDAQRSYSHGHWHYKRGYWAKRTVKKKYRNPGRVWVNGRYVRRNGRRVWVAGHYR